MRDIKGEFCVCVWGPHEHMSQLYVDVQVVHPT